MAESKKVLLGAHMSIAGGIDKAFYRGASIECTAIQIFTHSNRQWAIKDISKEMVVAVAQAKKETGIEHILVHASYLINLGSATAATLKKSKAALEAELKHCEDLSLPFLVLHPGSGNPDENACMQQISESLNEVLELSSNKVTILLEIMAGQGTSVGYTFEQLAHIRKGVREKKNRILH